MDELGHYFQQLSQLCAQFDVEALGAARDRIVHCLSSGKAVFVAGNGGSAANAEHWANDLRSAALQADWTPVHVEALSVSSVEVTALANDHDYERIFENALRARASAGDLLIVLSASGNSRNVLCALREARRRQMSSIGLLGKGGGEAVALCDIVVVVQADDYGHIEDLHLACDHAITQQILLKARQG